MKPNKLLFKNENKENMKSFKEECQVLEIKINTSRVLYGLKIIVFKPKIISNQIKPWVRKE